MLHPIQEKTHKLFNMPNIQLERFAFPLIQFRYPSDKLAKLEEVLQKLGFLQLKRGESKSEKNQLLMDKLIEGQLVITQAGVTTNPKFRIRVRSQRLHVAKVYDQGLRTTVTAFATKVNPIAHGRVKLESLDIAKLLVEQAKLIIRQIYLIRKSRKRAR